MSEDCNYEQLYNFKDEDHFFQFEKELQSNKKLQPVDHVDRQGPEPLLKSREIHYKCESSDEVYILSINEHIKKSFFLSQQNATKYKAKLQSKDKAQSKGCLLLIVLVLSLFMFLAFY